MNGTFHQAYSYKDALGNFNGIFRSDLVKTNGNWALQNIDDNAYFYQTPLSSKISSILDYTGNQLGYKANSGTYAYDANGNTTYDPANKISTLYNYLNLPSRFTKDDGSKQEFVYDFSGKKWQVKEFNLSDSLLSSSSYLGAFEFENNSLNLVHHGKGFIKNLKSIEYKTGTQNGNIQGTSIVSTQKIGEGKYEAENAICLLPGFEASPADKFVAIIDTFPNAYQWQYTLSDHLGNVRVIFTDKNNNGLIAQSVNDSLNEVLSVRNYSPFGLELGGSQKNLDYQNQYQFGGKEHNNFSNYIDFGRRGLDAPLGRFSTQDRFSEKYYGLSSMGYAAGNPINLIDVNGDSLWVNFDGQKFLYNNNQLFDKNGKKYNGSNSFINKVFSSLNTLSNSTLANEVIKELQGPNVKLEISNLESGGGERTLSFQSNTLGGTINASNIEALTDGQSAVALAHESFHALQNLKNQRFNKSLATINNEVGAYLFGAAVSLDIGVGFQSLGNAPYDTPMNSLLFSDKFNLVEYRKAVINFKTHSTANSTGLYNKFGIDSNLSTPLISKYFPLIK